MQLRPYLHKVQFYETDGMSIVHHGNHILWMEEARTDFMDQIGFNNKYLMDALKAAPADKVRLELASGVSPCVILPAEGEENFLYMVLPVRLKAGE